MSWKLFPISPGTKVPALPGDWRSHSTNDLAQIEAWRDAGYSLAVDCGASGLFVVDIDGEEGLASAASMDLPPTYTVRTPRGGEHRYFAGEGPNTVCKLGDKVDTRGASGYVVWEGPGYELVSELPVADLPAWIVPALNVRKDRKASTGAELDKPQNIRRARSYLSIRPPAIGTRPGDPEPANDYTYQTAQALRDLGLSEDRALGLMLDEWNDRCIPPWGEEELAQIVANAWAYGQNEEGAQAFDFDPAARFAGVVFEAPAKIVAEADPYRPWKPSELLLRPPPSFLFPGFLPRESVGGLIAESDSGKTFFALHCGLTLAAGIAGMGREAGPPSDVLYIPMEGSQGVAHDRIPAWGQKYGVPQEQLDRLRVVENFPDVLDSDELEKMIRRQRDAGLSYELLMVDTYGRALGASGLDENKSAEVRKFVARMEAIKRELGCTVWMIHHESDSTKRVKGQAPKGAGSYALRGDCDFWMWVDTCWVSRTMAINCGKMKGAKRFDPFHFQIEDTASSLTLQGILPSEYRSITTVEDSYSAAKIGAALVRLGAIGPEKAVTSYVLASALYKAQIGEPESEAQAAIDRIARKLNALGKGRLEQYVSGKGWHLPE